MNDRLDKLLMAEQLTPAKFADIIGVQRSSISHVVSGRNKPSFDFIVKVLHRFPRVSPDWLIMGKGEMYKQMVQTSLFDDPVVNQAIPTQNSDPKPIASEKFGGDNVDIEQISEEQANVDTLNNSVYSSDMLAFDKEIEQIVVFYKDRSFRSYTPSKE